MVAAGIVFVLAGLVPMGFILSAGLSDDETATASATTEMIELSLMALAAGLIGALVTWLVARTNSRGIRRVGLTFLVIGAGAWGVVTGFLGAVSVNLARHPTWDDA